jgi:ubiquinone/menaquinone biosynthesis C-methylase UbiE
MKNEHPSLETLVENGDLDLEILHPGGLDLTRELAERCHIGKGTEVLDVASGTGESACFLSGHFGCRVVGVDLSEYFLEKARRKAIERGLRLDFIKGDAHQLPFDEDSFDAVISECTTCLLDKERAIREMARVAKPGGYVGIHDLCWSVQAPENMKARLAEIEGERPEALEDWVSLFSKVGLSEVIAVDQSGLMPAWLREIKAKLGLVGQLRIFLKILRGWGIAGLHRIRESERIFKSAFMGYGIIVGKKT